LVNFTGGLTKVGIRDFQRIASANLVFETGITGIVGTTNAGKTAIFRAIRSALENPASGKTKIRHGQKQAVVALRIDDGTPVVWVRKPNGVTYKVGDQIFDKCGRSRLCDLHSTFSIGHEEDSRFHFHGENQPLFPFGCSPSELFGLIENVYNI